MSSHTATLLTQEQNNPGRGGRPELPCRMDRSGVRTIQPSTPISTENSPSPSPVDFFLLAWLAGWYGRLILWLGAKPGTRPARGPSLSISLPESKETDSCWVRLFDDGAMMRLPRWKRFYHIYCTSSLPSLTCRQGAAVTCLQINLVGPLLYGP